MDARVALVSSDYLPNIGGVAAHVHNLARELARQAVDVCVITTGDGRKSGTRRRLWPTWVTRDGVRVLELGVPGLPRGIGRAAWERFGMARAVDRLSRRPLVLHWHDAQWSAPLIAPQTGAARVFTNHTSNFLQALDTGQGLDHWRWQFGLADRLIAPSQERATGAVTLGYPAERVSVIPNAVDASLFRPDESLRQAARRRLGAADHEVVVLAPCRMVPVKGVIDLAHALKRLGDLRDRLRLVFAGDSGARAEEYELEVREAVRRSPFADRVTYLGRVPNQDMPSVYAAADIVALPSLKEATSIAGLEAMACGLPLVGTNVGGIPEILEHEQTGLLVEPGAPHELAVAIRRLVDDPPLRAALGAAARRTVTDRFTWSAVAKRTVAVYRLALQQHQRQAQAAATLGERART